jgi:hypothetical protein
VFIDLAKEAAIAGSIAVGTFEAISPSALIPADAFVDERWRIVYSVACELRNQISDTIICAQSVSDAIAFHDLDREFQRAFDSTNTLDWHTWPEHTDTSLAYGPWMRPLEYCLSELGHLYAKRQQAEIGRKLQEGLITGEEALKILEDILHQNNGHSLQDRFDMNKLDQKPVTIFKLCNQSVATPGNLVVIHAQPKAGKSAVISAMLAAVMSEDDLGDFLGFNASPNLAGHALIHFDTEQSRYDHQQIVLRGLRRAGLSAPPSWLRSYCLTGLDIKTRRSLLVAELEHATKDCGGVFALLVDGIADFVVDVNDIPETHNFVVELHALAIKYDCVFILVLHENPGGKGAASEKIRGHLGSQLERKAESNIRLTKDPNSGTITIYTEKSRHANIPAADGHRFKWDEQNQTHASTADQPEHNAKTDDFSDLVEHIFDCQEARDNAGGLTWSEILDRLCALMAYKSRDTARRKFNAIANSGLIEKSPTSKPARYWPNVGKK